MLCFFYQRQVPLCGIHLTGWRISCKKGESQKAFELRRQLNPRVGRRCAPDDRRRISCKKGESRKAFEFRVSLIRVLDGAVRRTTGGCSAAPLNGRTASVQHGFKPQRSLPALSALKTVLGVIY